MSACSIPLDMPRCQRRVVVANLLHFHHEIMAGAIYGLQLAGCSVDVVLDDKHDLYNMKGTMEPWFKGKYVAREQLLVSSGNQKLPERRAWYDTILITTAFDGVYYDWDYHDQMVNALLDEGGPPRRFILVVHNVEKLGRLNDGAGLDLVRRILITGHSVRLLTIAPFVADAVLRIMGMDAEWYVPIFPVRNGSLTDTTSWDMRSARESRARPIELDPGARALLCLQGNISPARRNYNGIFKAAASLEDELRKRHLEVWLIGKVVDKSTVELLPSWVRVLPNLSFQARNGAARN